jgi:hypothetical protein
MTRKELDYRWQHAHVFDRRQNRSDDSQLPVNWSSEMLPSMLDDLRELIYLVVLPVINTTLADKPNVRALRFRNGRCVLSMKDFEEFVLEYDPNATGAVPLADMRKLVHYVIFDMWVKHHWALKGEQQILNLLGFRYDDNRMSDGKARNRTTRGGFIKVLMVKKLEMEREKIKNAWANVTFERFYKRDVFKVSGEDSDKEDEGSTVTGKRKKPDRSHLRKYLRHFTQPTDGFNRTILLLPGHPIREKMDNADLESEDSKMSEAELQQVMIKNFTETLQAHGSSFVQNMSSAVSVTR